jgi:hypothetical protein
MNKLLTAIPLATFAGATLLGGFVASMGTASADPNYDHHDDHQQADRQDNRRDDNRRDDSYRRDAYRYDDHRDDRQAADHRRWVAAHWEGYGPQRYWVPGSWIDVNLSF